ncbi:uncharacterized protein LOC135369480 [Ornithodoros turicata]|uniref:uncharacterized protein LOC135369480 n=1 Tax=Ornithodoros turicata TaxID=34597 RepID=UPI003138B8BB
MISIVLLSCIVAVVYYLTKIDERYENTEPSLEFPVATTHNGHRYTAPVKTSTPLKHKPRVLQHKRLQGKEEDSPVTLLDSDDDSFPSHTLKGGRHEQHATRTTKQHATRRTHRTSRRSSKPPITTTTTTTTALRNSTMNSTLETHEEGGNQTTEESSSDGASTRKKTSKSAEQPRILVCVANGIAKADRYPPPGLCNYVIYAPVGYKRGLLRHNGTGFNVFKEQARNSRTSRWGIGMVPSDVLAAGTGVMGDDAPKFREEVQRLIREFRVVGYGLLDVHITAIDYIDTMNDYLEFYKYFKATLQKMQVPQDASTFLLFGVRVLNMIYSHRDTFRDKIRQVVKYIDIFIYQTHVSKVTRNCLSVFPSNRYYPGADDQDSLDDAVRTLSPPIYDRDGFHVVISLTLSLLRFNMKGADLEQIRKPCSNMTSMPFTVPSQNFRY